MTVALDIDIRFLRPEDASQVADLLAVAFAEEFEGTGAGTQSLIRQLRTGGLAQHRVVRWLQPYLGVEFAFFVAAVGPAVVGCTGVMGQRLPVINSVAVRPEYRRRGIAEALVQAAERFAAEHGHDRVVLDVLAHNTPAITLYEKLGYGAYHRFRTYVRPVTREASAAHEQVTPAPRLLGGRLPRRIPAGRAEPHLLAPAPALPPDYSLEFTRPGTAMAFEQIERAALPVRYREVSPPARGRYSTGPPSTVERLMSSARSYRRTVLHRGVPAGYFLAHAGPAVREGRVEYPLLPPEHTAALPGVLEDAAGFMAYQGASSARVDLSDERPDHHAAVESAGFAHQWTFVQMVKWLRRGASIPVHSHRSVHIE